jgi:dinuclear metal center YbgI/SA1388 family protein
MKTPALANIASYCDRLLRLTSFQDWPGAANGLQVENNGRVTRIAAAVDATCATIRRATAARADLLVVHHGLFWTPPQPWTGTRYEQMRLLLAGNLAVYSAHLPLDAHPRLGNNARLCRALGFRQLAPFFFQRDAWLGFRTRTRVDRGRLVRRLEGALSHHVRVVPGGPAVCRRIGVVTGGAGGDLQIAAREGIDTFITGEGPHWTFGAAEDAGINVLYGGHYATETFGVKALVGHLAGRYRLPWTFIDHPTGL